MNQDHLFPRQDELGILGCCLIGGIDTAIDAVATVPVDAIFSDDVRESYSIIEQLATQGDRCDLDHITREWARRNGGRSVPTQMWQDAMEATPSAVNLPFYTKGVLDAYRRRRVRDMGSVLINKAVDASNSVDELMAEAEGVLAGQETDQVEVLNGKEAAAACIKDLEDRFRRQGATGGIESGFPWLDRYTDGFQPKEQAVVAARPSIGKTAFALSVFEHACIRGNVPTLFITLEMSPGALLRRMASSVCGIPMSTLRRGSFSERDFQNLTKYQITCSKAPFLIADGVNGMSVATACAVIRRSVRKLGVRLVIVDYLQKMLPTTKHEKRTYEVAEVSGKLKGIAAKTGVALLTLAQLNRESEKDKRLPALRDLADSGQIERDADMVCLLHRDRANKPRDGLLIIAKQRDGECGLVKLDFDGSHCKFNSVSENDEKV